MDSTSGGSGCDHHTQRGTLDVPRRRSIFHSREFVGLLPSGQDHKVQTSVSLLVLLRVLEVVPRGATVCVLAILGFV